MTQNIEPIRNYPFRGKIYTASQIDEMLNNLDLSDYYNKTETDNLLANKQDSLTAGDNITISDENVINAIIPPNDFVKLDSVDWSSVITIDDDGNYIANKDIIIIAKDPTPHKESIVGYYPKGFNFDYNSGTSLKGANRILIWRVEPWSDSDNYLCNCYARVDKIFSSRELSQSDVVMYGLYIRSSNNNENLTIAYQLGYSYYAGQTWKNDTIELWYKG